MGKVKNSFTRRVGAAYFAPYERMKDTYTVQAEQRPITSALESRPQNMTYMTTGCTVLRADYSHYTRPANARLYSFTAGKKVQ